MAKIKVERITRCISEEEGKTMEELTPQERQEIREQLEEAEKAEPEVESEAEGRAELEQMTVSELRDLAKEYRLNRTHKMKKAELIKAILKAEE